MDNLTHSLVGAALGRAGLYRRTRLAAGALIIGANLPDIDVIGLPFGENLAFRRGITHGPLAMLLLPLLLTGALVVWGRVRAPRSTTADDNELRPRQLLLLSYVGVLTHPFFDWLNSYGVRLLYPFSDRWFYGDSIFIIDLWVWIALGTGVWIARRRSKQQHPDAERPARISLAGVAAYVLLMIAGSAYAREYARQQASAQGTAVVDVMAAPVPLNPFVRSIVIETSSAYQLGRVAFFPSISFSTGVEIARNAVNASAQRAVASGAFDDFLYWSRFPYFTVTVRGDSADVKIGDARFPGSGAVSNSFSLTATVPATK